MSKYPWQVLAAAGILALAALACGATPPTPAKPATRATVETGLRQVWHQPAGQNEREVVQPSSAGAGDRLWTNPDGRGFLKWKDLTVKLYRQTTMHVDPCDVAANTCMQVAVGVALSGGVAQINQHVRYTTDHAEIELIGTTVMVAYEPARQLTFVRVFAGKVQVRNLGAQTGAPSIVEAREWALVEPGRPPVVSDRLEDMRGLASDLGLWDTFHEVELDVAGGFGPAPVARADVDIIFVEQATATPYRPVTLTPTPTPVPQCRVVASPLNLRSGPGTRYVPPIAALTAGTVLIPFERDATGTWIRARSPATGVTGWVPAGPEYVQCNISLNALPVGSAPPPTFTPTPTATRTPPPPTTVPPAPVLLSPNDGSWQGMPPRAVTVQWQPVQAPSGITRYQVEAQWGIGAAPSVWRPFASITETGTRSSTVIPAVYGQEGGYIVRWRVRAVDGRGAQGYWSAWRTFVFAVG